MYAKRRDYQKILTNVKTLFLPMPLLAKVKKEGVLKRRNN